ncbi:MAG: hypothetical protein U9R38_07080 [Candidatus Margulisiibacteriota bacterium]|nr:hypothetical protein [Candidatus Margulisiibacteriota bacterium]
MKKYVLVLLMLLVSIPALSVPQQIYFQGILLDSNGDAITGARDMTFKLYSAATGGTALDTDAHTGVSVSSGLYTVKLSIDSSHFNGNDRYIGITVGTDSEMTPRVQVLTVPYVYNAANADSAINSDTVDNFHASSTPTAGYLLPLNATGTFPVSAIPQGPGSTLNADLLDGYHASDFSPASGNYVLLGPPSIQSTTTANAVWVSSSADAGVGIYGEATDTDGRNADYGIKGRANSTGSYGVYGDGYDDGGGYRRWGYVGGGGDGAHGRYTDGNFGSLGGKSGAFVYGVRGYSDSNYGGWFTNTSLEGTGVYINVTRNTGIGMLVTNEGSLKSAILAGQTHAGHFRGDVTVEGDVYADNFYGDGSNLTGISGSGYVLLSPATAQSTAAATAAIWVRNANASGIGISAEATGFDGIAIYGYSGDDSFDNGYAGYFQNDSNNNNYALYALSASTDSGAAGYFVNNQGGERSAKFATGSAAGDFTGQVWISGTLQANGNADLGNETTDTLTITASIDSDVIPDIDINRDLGSSGNRWRYVHAATFEGDGSNLTGIDTSFSGGTITGETTFEADASFEADVFIGGKLTVVGTIDPVAIILEPDAGSTKAIQVINTGGSADILYFSQDDGMLITEESGGNYIQIGNAGDDKAVYALAKSTSGIGVYGLASSNSGTNYGGYFRTQSEDGYGLLATNEASGGKSAFLAGQGKNAAGGDQHYAGYFYGDVRILGNLSKSSGTFVIDHPVDPSSKVLRHSFVESPDMKNVYDGVIALDEKGEAVVTMPDYFEALNVNFRYQLTTIGDYAPVYIKEKISDNTFKIAGGKPGMEVSWMVTGSRQDVYALENPIIVEEEKETKGVFLYPEGFNKEHANN